MLRRATACHRSWSVLCAHTRPELAWDASAAPASRLARAAPTAHRPPQQLYLCNGRDGSRQQAGGRLACAGMTALSSAELREPSSTPSNTNPLPRPGSAHTVPALSRPQLGCHEPRPVCINRLQAARTAGWWPSSRQWRQSWLAGRPNGAPRVQVQTGRSLCRSLQLASTGHGPRVPLLFASRGGQWGSRSREPSSCSIRSTSAGSAKCWWDRQGPCLGRGRHRVGQAACAPDDRQGAVAHGHQLRQPHGSNMDGTCAQRCSRWDCAAARAWTTRAPPALPEAGPSPEKAGGTRDECRQPHR